MMTRHAVKREVVWVARNPLQSVAPCNSNAQFYIHILRYERWKDDNIDAAEDEAEAIDVQDGEVKGEEDKDIENGFKAEEYKGK